MVVKESKYAESIKPIEVEQAAETQVETVEEVQPETQPEAQVETQVEEQQPEENIVQFDIPVEEVKEEVKPIDWREAIKSVDRKELLKELGVEFDEFDLEFAKYRKNGGDPYKYLQVKAVDYSKIPDEQLAKEALKNEYPFLDADKLNKLFISRYKQDELASEEDRELGAIQMQADAYKLRQQRIAEQQNFKIPEAAQQQPQTADNSQVEQMRQFIINHEATKSLAQSKRVTVDAGEDGKFNFNIGNPQVLVDMMMDGETYRKYTTNQKGEPDLGKMYKVALFTVNPDKYEKDLINYGKQLGKKALLDEGQNAKRPIERPAIPTPQGKIVVTGSGKVGAR